MHRVLPGYMYFSDLHIRNGVELYWEVEVSVAYQAWEMVMNCIKSMSRDLYVELLLGDIWSDTIQPGFNIIMVTWSSCCILIGPYLILCAVIG